MIAFYPRRPDPRTYSCNLFHQYLALIKTTKQVALVSLLLVRVPFNFLALDELNGNADHPISIQQLLAMFAFS
jgi:hypothetical protein